jgi:hypothetical protein
MFKEMVAQDADKPPQERAMSKADVAGTMRELGISERLSGPHGIQIIALLAGLGVIIGLIAWGLSGEETPREKIAPKVVEAPREIVRPTYDEEAVVGAADANWKSQFKKQAVDGGADAKSNGTRTANPTQKNAPARKPSGITLKKERPARELKARESLAMRSMGREETLNTKEFDARRNKALSDMRNASQVNSEMMDRMFNRRGKELRLCAQRHELSGRVSVSFRVSTTGETKDHSITRPGGADADPDAVKCIKKIIQRWKFPRQEKETTFRRTLVM